jgi:hypothetical protein
MTAVALRWLPAAAVAAYLEFVAWNQRAVPDGPLMRYVLPVLAIAILIVLVVIRRSPPNPALVCLALVAASSLIVDRAQLGVGFSDLGIYLNAGRHALAGEPVYQLEPLSAMPADYTTLPYLYPPPTIPFFAALAWLPANLGGVVFVVGSVALLMAGLRRLGLGWAWTATVLLWPPVFTGIMSGNVSIATAGLLFLGPWFGAGLVLAPLLKPYNAIAGLWLVREARWRPLLVGLAIVAAVSVLTLPLVGGLDAWRAWLDGLVAFTESERRVGQLHGISPHRFGVPTIVVIAAAILVTVAALRRRGTDGLGRLGIATIVAQPTLYLHGFVVALPQILTLRSAWLWPAVAVLSIVGRPPGLASSLESPGPWLAVAIVLLAWLLPMRLRQRSAEAADDADGWGLGLGGHTTGMPGGPKTTAVIARIFSGTGTKTDP